MSGKNNVPVISSERRIVQEGVHAVLGAISVQYPLLLISGKFDELTRGPRYLAARPRHEEGFPNRCK